MAFNILEHVTFTYQPIWGPKRQLIGVRLRVRALHPDSVDAAHLLEALENEWSRDAPFLLVSFTDQAQLLQALAFNPHDSIWLELPDFGEYTPPEVVQAVALARRVGHRLVQRSPLARARVLGGGNGAKNFRYLLDLWPDQVAQAMIASEQKGRPGGQATPLLPDQLYHHLGTRPLAAHALDDAKGWGVCGWPTEDVLKSHQRYGVPVDRRTLVRVQQALMHESSMDAVEHLIHQDAVLTHRVLRLVNSPLFGSTRQVETVRQALFLLGQTRLRDWLLELMPGSATDVDLLPVRQSLVLRGKLMAQLMNAGVQNNLATEIYVTGLFSGLGQLTHEPLGVALGRVPVSSAVSDALLRQSGPYHVYLDIAQRMESPEQLEHLANVCAEAGFGLDHVNRALLRTFSQWRNVL
ncbi:HDOD domain-containing protein [Hydrogenophaga aquatica]